MGVVGRVRHWLRSIAARQRLEREMLDEMSAHIEQAAERFRARGMSERDALLAARREFGQPGVVQEQARDARGARWVDSVAADLRYALRHYARTPLTTATIVLTLTLGIGATASMFSIADGVFNRPPPGIPEDAALVLIRGIEVGKDRPHERLMSWPEVMEYAALSDRFTAVAGWVTENVIVDLEDGAAGVGSVRAQFVSPNIFSTLGVKLASGPGFVQTRLDDLSRPELTAVVSRAFADGLGGVALAIGKDIKLNGVTVRIVGVTHPRFNGPTRNRSAQTVWLPLSSYPVVMGSSSRVFAYRDTSLFRAVARLRPKVTTANAMAAVSVIGARLNADSKSTEALEEKTDVIPLRGELSVRGISTDDIAQSAVTGAVVLLVLLVCTTTVSSLLVGAAVARRQEIGVRLALGASRARVVRQLLTENAILALTGGALGLLVFAWVCRLSAALFVGADITPDRSTAGFTVIAAMVTALLCGLSPALHATRSGVADALKDGAHGTTSRSRLQRILVVAQIALTQPLLVALMMTISVAMRGFGPHPGSALGDRIVIAELNSYAGTLAKRADPVPGVMRRLAASPVVMAVIPQRRGYGPMTLEVASGGSISRTVFKARAQGVPPNYFHTLDIRVAMGREFAPADSASGASPSVIIGTNAATRLFGAINPIGKRLYELANNGKRVGELEIVGVVASDQIGGSDDDDYLLVYLPYTSDRRLDVLLIRTTGRAEPLIPALRALVRAEASMLPISSMRTLEQVDRERRQEVIQDSGASAAAGLTALLLASIGLYAVVAIAVGQRRREIGVRVALGATPRQVISIFFNGGLRLCLVGLLIGLPLSVAAIKVLGSQGVVWRANLPAIALFIALIVVAVASLATWLPARRAAGVDPLIALRAD